MRKRRRSSLCGRWAYPSESLIGVETGGVRQPVVSQQYLKTLVQIANERFVENEEDSPLQHGSRCGVLSPQGKEDWEDAQARRERKREEGLRRREELKKTKSQAADQPDVDFAIQQPDVVYFCFTLAVMIPTALCFPVYNALAEIAP